jgi:hypothetical protein
VGRGAATGLGVLDQAQGWHSQVDQAEQKEGTEHTGGLSAFIYIKLFHPCSDPGRWSRESVPVSQMRSTGSRGEDTQQGPPAPQSRVHMGENAGCRELVCLCPGPQRPRLAGVHTRNFRLCMCFLRCGLSIMFVHLPPFAFYRMHAQGLGTVRVRGMIYELSWSS